MALCEVWVMETWQFNVRLLLDLSHTKSPGTYDTIETWGPFQKLLEVTLVVKIFTNKNNIIAGLVCHRLHTSHAGVFQRLLHFPIYKNRLGHTRNAFAGQ